MAVRWLIRTIEIVLLSRKLWGSGRPDRLTLDPRSLRRAGVWFCVHQIQMSLSLPSNRQGLTKGLPRLPSFNLRRAIEPGRRNRPDRRDLLAGLAARASARRAGSAFGCKRHGMPHTGRAIQQAISDDPTAGGG